MAYVVIDIETTGLSKHYHKITEIAAAKIEKGKIKEQFHSLVNPEQKIPKFITNLTGIDDEMVKDAPLIHEVMPEFLGFLKEDIFVAHNATFDYGFLEHNASKINLVLKNKRLCTRKLANRLLPELRSKKLCFLCEHLGIENNQAHRAMSDVLATAEVFNCFSKMLDKKGFKKQEDVIRFEKMTRKQIENLNE